MAAGFQETRVSSSHKNGRSHRLLASTQNELNKKFPAVARRGWSGNCFQQHHAECRGRNIRKQGYGRQHGRKKAVRDRNRSRHSPTTFFGASGRRFYRLALRAAGMLSPRMASCQGGDRTVIGGKQPRQRKNRRHAEPHRLTGCPHEPQRITDRTTGKQGISRKKRRVPESCELNGHPPVQGLGARIFVVEEDKGEAGLPLDFLLVAQRYVEPGNGRLCNGRHGVGAPGTKAISVWVLFIMPAIFAGHPGQRASFLFRNST